MVWSLLFFARAVSVGCNIHVCVRRTEVSADDLIVWSYGHNGFDWIGLTGTERTKGKRYCAAEFDIAVSQREWMGIYTWLCFRPVHLGSTVLCTVLYHQHQ